MVSGIWIPKRWVGCQAVQQSVQSLLPGGAAALELPEPAAGDDLAGLGPLATLQAQLVQMVILSFWSPGTISRPNWSGNSIS